MSAPVELVDACAAIELVGMAITGEHVLAGRSLEDDRIALQKIIEAVDAIGISLQDIAHDLAILRRRLEVLCKPGNRDVTAIGVLAGVVAQRRNLGGIAENDGGEVAIDGMRLTIVLVGAAIGETTGATVEDDATSAAILVIRGHIGRGMQGIVLIGVATGYFAAEVAHPGRVGIGFLETIQLGC